MMQAVLEYSVVRILVQDRAAWPGAWSRPVDGEGEGERGGLTSSS